MQNQISPKRRGKQACAWFSALSAADQLYGARRSFDCPEAIRVHQAHYLQFAGF